MIRRIFVLFLLFGFLTGCTAPLKPVTFSQSKPTVSSTKTVSVHLHTGIVDGGSSTSLVPTGTFFVPVTIGSDPEFQFNVENQMVFVESLKNEITRLNLFSDVTEKGADVSISVIFAQTFHDPTDHRYLLTVAMRVINGVRTMDKIYRIDSSKGDSWWTQMNTDASTGKSKAAQKLIDAIIPDLESWIRGDTSESTNTT